MLSNLQYETCQRSYGICDTDPLAKGVMVFVILTLFWISKRNIKVTRTVVSFQWPYQEWRWSERVLLSWQSHDKMVHSPQLLKWHQENNAEAQRWWMRLWITMSIAISITCAPQRGVSGKEWNLRDKSFLSITPAAVQR